MRDGGNQFGLQEIEVLPDKSYRMNEASATNIKGGEKCNYNCG